MSTLRAARDRAWWISAALVVSLSVACSSSSDATADDATADGAAGSEASAGSAQAGGSSKAGAPASAGTSSGKGGAPSKGSGGTTGTGGAGSGGSGVAGQAGSGGNAGKSTGSSGAGGGAGKSSGKGGSGGTSASGGAGSGGTMASGGSGGFGGDPPGVTWMQASLTEFESYPAPGSPECVQYNGCMWEGQFAALSGVQSEAWVMAHNIVAVHSKEFAKYKLHTVRLRKNGHEIDAVVYDECADSDCSGCCTENAMPSGHLLDLEKYTAQRFGVPADGQVEWRCLDCPLVWA